MKTDITPRMNTVANTPQHNILIQQAHSQRLTFFDIRDMRHYMPIMNKNGIVEHKPFPFPKEALHVALS
jgi:hypothetical protein